MMNDVGFGVQKSETKKFSELVELKKWFGEDRSKIHNMWDSCKVRSPDLKM
jgi:hypothetical protein